jgi:Flp pilus assembly protein TadG
MDDRGSASVELVLLTPVFILLLFFVVTAGRLAVSRNQIDGAARDAAREASTWRSATDASNHGVLQGLSDLQGGHSSCRNPQVTIDTSGLRPGGEVVAAVSCTIALGDISGLRVGPSRTMQARAVAVVDTFRSR